VGGKQAEWSTAVPPGHLVQKFRLHTAPVLSLGKKQCCGSWIHPEALLNTVVSIMDQITIKTPNPKGRLFIKIYLLRDLTTGPP
jgi:hypothetical protein